MAFSPGNYTSCLESLLISCHDGLLLQRALPLVQNPCLMLAFSLGSYTSSLLYFFRILVLWGPSLQVAIPLVFFAGRRPDNDQLPAPHHGHLYPEAHAVGSVALLVHVPQETLKLITLVLWTLELLCMLAWRNNQSILRVFHAFAKCLQPNSENYVLNCLNFPYMDFFWQNYWFISMGHL